jgi:hypothetical protein
MNFCPNRKGGHVTTIGIEDIKDINVSASKIFVDIDFKHLQDSTTRIALDRSNAELLSQRLTEALNKV